MFDMAPTSLNTNKKRCSRCHELKSLSDFAKCKSNKDGLQNHCKQCNKAYRKYVPRDYSPH